MYTLTDNYNELMSVFDNADPNWIQFVRDHMSIIKKDHMSKMYISPDNMNAYQYRLEDFLENNKISQSTMWLILEINQMNSAMEFHDLEYLFMPDYSFIFKLYELFNSTEANKESER